MSKQSVTRLSAKHAARTTINRAITANLGSGLLGSICKVLASQAIKQTDKYKHDEDFNILYKDK